ncbi:hypothetical protein GXW82_04075 [Streptacidiphilus sp. 4-A2]|nr:hypothetical protein [Streptacidiphilus sp. 4-A2]
MLFPPVPRSGRWTLRGIGRLAGPVLEVRDGRLALRPHDDPEVSHTGDMELLLARQIVESGTPAGAALRLRPRYRARKGVGRGRGLTGDAAEAVVEAPQIAGALRARASGHALTHHQDAGAPHDPADGDLQEEVAWLIRVAVPSGLPIVPAALARCDRPPEAGAPRPARTRKPARIRKPTRG